MVDHRAEPANLAVSAHEDCCEIRESWSERIAVLSACGVVDWFSTPELSKAICNALRKAPAGLVIDLTEVNFLASVGMRVLAAAHQAADAMSVRFGVVAEGSATSRPIRLLGIDTILSLYPALGDALRDLREV
jgi:anti-sigma B factor antagonist